MKNEAKRHCSRLAATRHAPDLSVPTFSGEDADRALTRRFGPGRGANRPDVGEGLFGNTRVLFVDELDGCRPVAYWVPEVRPETLRFRMETRAL